jgi:hypothetical protein
MTSTTPLPLNRAAGPQPVKTTLFAGGNEGDVR